MAIDRTSGVAGQRYDEVRLWCWVAELTTELSTADQRAIRTTVANSVAAGWCPTRTEITDLTGYATGAIPMAHYLTTIRGNRFPTSSADSRRPR